MVIKEYTTYREKEIFDLYSDVGWIAYTNDMDTLRKGFEHSMLVLAAYEEGNLLGIVRAVGDGHTIVFIQDILVFSKYQNRGIGTALVKAILDRYKNVRQIQLATEQSYRTIAFYKSIGFCELSEIGCCGFMKN